MTEKLYLYYKEFPLTWQNFGDNITGRRRIMPFITTLNNPGTAPPEPKEMPWWVWVLIALAVGGAGYGAIKFFVH
jgi:hypothetical protein